MHWRKPRDVLAGCLAASEEPAAHSLGLGPVRSGPTTLPSVSRLVALLRLERDDLAVVVVHALGIGLVSLAVPLAAQMLVNTVVYTALMQPVVILALIVLVGLIAAAFLRMLQAIVSERMQQRFFVRTAHEAAWRLASASTSTFDNRSARELGATFLDVAIVQKSAATLLLDGLSVTLQAAVSLLLLAFYHPALLAFDVMLIACILGIMLGLGRGAVPSAIGESKAKYAAANWIMTLAESHRSFKSSGARAFAMQRTDAHAKYYLKARASHFRILLRQVIASYVLQAVGTAALLGLGTLLVFRGQLTLGQLVAAELIVTSVLTGVSKYGKYLESYYDLVAAIDKIGPLIDLPSERAANVDRPVAADAPTLAFSELVIDELHPASVDAPPQALWPKARIAILIAPALARSGQILSDTLCGLRAPLAGQLWVEGVDATARAPAEIRAVVTCASLRDTISGTLRENVTLHAPHAATSEVHAVLATIGLAASVSALPDALETAVDARQPCFDEPSLARLALARALLAKPRVLVVDRILDALSYKDARALLDAISLAYPELGVVVLTTLASRARLCTCIMHLRRCSPVAETSP